MDDTNSSGCEACGPIQFLPRILRDAFRNYPRFAGDKTKLIGLKGFEKSKLKRQKLTWNSKLLTCVPEKFKSANFCFLKPKFQNKNLISGSLLKMTADLSRQYKC